MGNKGLSRKKKGAREEEEIGNTKERSFAQNVEMQFMQRLVQEKGTSLIEKAVLSGIETAEFSNELNGVCVEFDTFVSYSLFVKFLLSKLHSCPHIKRYDWYLLSIVKLYCERQKYSVLFPTTLQVTIIPAISSVIEFQLIGDLTDSLTLITLACDVCLGTFLSKSHDSFMEHKRYQHFKLSPAVVSIIHHKMFPVLFQALKWSKSHLNILNETFMEYLHHVIVLVAMLFRYVGPNLELQNSFTQNGLEAVFEFLFSSSEPLQVLCVRTISELQLNSKILNQTIVVQAENILFSQLRPLVSFPDPSTDIQNITVADIYSALNTGPTWTNPPTKPIVHDIELENTLSVYFDFIESMQSETKVVSLGHLFHTFKYASSTFKRMIFSHIQSEFEQLYIDHFNFVIHPARDDLALKSDILMSLSQDAKIQLFAKMVTNRHSIPAIGTCLVLTWTALWQQPPRLNPLVCSCFKTLLKTRDSDKALDLLATCASLSILYASLNVTETFEDLMDDDIGMVISAICELCFTAHCQIESTVIQILKHVMVKCAYHTRYAVLLNKVFENFRMLKGDYSLVVLRCFESIEDSIVLERIWRTVDVATALLHLVHCDLNIHQASMQLMKTFTTMFHHYNNAKHLAKVADAYRSMEILLSTSSELDQCFLGLFHMMFDGLIKLTYDTASGFSVNGDRKLVLNVDALVVVQSLLLSQSPESILFVHVLELLLFLVTCQEQVDSQGRFVGFLTQPISSTVPKYTEMFGTWNIDERNDPHESLANATAISSVQDGFFLELIKLLDGLNDKVSFLILQLIVLVGASYTSVRELKSLFRNIWQISSQSAPIACALVRSVNFVLHEESSYLYLDGLRSGITLLPADKTESTHYMNDNCESACLKWDTNSISFASWVRYLGGHSQSCLLELLAGQLTIHLSVESNGRVELVVTKCEELRRTIGSSSSFLTIGKWQHIAVIVKTTIIKGILSNSNLQVAELYIDGLKVASEKCPCLNSETLGRCSIGCSVNGSNCFTGCLKFTQIWMSGLNSSHVASLFTDPRKKIHSNSLAMNLGSVNTLNCHFIDPDRRLQFVGCVHDRPGTKLCFRKGATRAIMAVGGTAAILPILALEVVSGGELGGCALFLLGNAISRYIRADKRFVIEAISVVEYLLLHVASSSIDEMTVQGVIYFVGMLESDAALLKQGVHGLLLNLDIWSRAQNPQLVIHAIVDYMLPKFVHSADFGILSMYSLVDLCVSRPSVNAQQVPPLCKIRTESEMFDPQHFASSVFSPENLNEYQGARDQSTKSQLISSLELFDESFDDLQTNSELREEIRRMHRDFVDPAIPISAILRLECFQNFIQRVLDAHIATYKNGIPADNDIQAFFYLLVSAPLDSSFTVLILDRFLSIAQMHPELFLDCFDRIKLDVPLVIPTVDNLDKILVQPERRNQITVDLLTRFLASNNCETVSNALACLSVFVPIITPSLVSFIGTLLEQAIRQSDWNCDQVTALCTSCISLAVSVDGILLSFNTLSMIFDYPLKAAGRECEVEVLKILMVLLEKRVNCDMMLSHRNAWAPIFNAVEREPSLYVSFLGTLVMFDLSKGSQSQNSLEFCLDQLSCRVSSGLMSFVLSALSDSLKRGQQVGSLYMDNLASIMMTYFNPKDDSLSGSQWMKVGDNFLSLLGAMDISPIPADPKEKVLHNDTCPCNSCVMKQRLVIPVLSLLLNSIRTSARDNSVSIKTSIQFLGAICGARILNEESLEFVLAEIQGLLVISEKIEDKKFEEVVVYLLGIVQSVEAIPTIITHNIRPRIRRNSKIPLFSSAVPVHGSREVLAAVSMLVQLEVDHRIHLAVAGDRDMQVSQTRWNSVLKQATHERGTWGNSSRTAFPFKKLDFFEGLPARCRIRIRSNESGTHHKLASSKMRDEKLVVDSDDSGQNVSTNTKIDLYKELQLARALGSNYFRANWSDDQPASEIADLSPSSPVSLGSPANRSRRELLQTQKSNDNLDKYRESHTKDVMVSVIATMVMNFELIPGKLLVNRSCIKFIREDAKSLHDGKFGVGKQWPLSQCRRVQFRRYNMTWNSLELMTGDVEKKSYFFTMQSKSECISITKVIAKLLKQEDALLTPMERATKSGAQQAWMNGNMSNFEYLMCLNDFAGRSYMDLAQYPIVPWILKDYTSERLDLSSEESFRDLRYPIGAQSEGRRELLNLRYNETKKNYQSLQVQQDTFWPLVWFNTKKDSNLQTDDSILFGPPWHYGSHYSSRGIMLWYMLRLEPFTSMHIELQDGKFDHPDRQFSSIAQAFHFATELAPRELIPEAFCNSEFLRNSCQFDLGIKQDGSTLDNVELPPWARNSPEEFIIKHREAMESEYVSANLHHWIDLIFGYKQQGHAAAESINVYFHLMYEGAVDLPKLKRVRPDLYRTVIKMIEEYGQSPPMLFQKPHPPRNSPVIPRFPLSEGPRRRLVQLASVCCCKDKGIVWISPQSSFFSKESLIFPMKKPSTSELYSGFVLDTTNHLRMIQIVQDELGAYSSVSTIVCEFGGPTNLLETKQHMFALAKASVVPIYCRSIPDMEGPVIDVLHNGVFTIFGCGYWDSSFRHVAVDSKDCSEAQSKEAIVDFHSDICTCMAVTEDGKFLVTGSKDCCICVWNIEPRKHTFAPVLKHVLLGHDDEIVCLAVSSSTDLIVSASTDGTCNIHTLDHAMHVHTISLKTSQLGHRFLHTWVGICHAVTPVVHVWCENEKTIYTYSVNARLISQKRCSTLFTLFAYSIDGKYLACCSRQNTVSVLNAHSLEVVCISENLDDQISCISTTAHPHSFLVGLQNGQSILVAIQ